MKIHVTGNSGSGKSTLARQLAHSLQLPFFSLDSIVWQPGWQKTPPDQRQVQEQALVDREAWVIDGVSQRVRSAADFVIFLDVPPLRCWWRAFNRSLRSLNRSRPELPEGCPEWRILLTQVRIIRGFRVNAGAAISQEAKVLPSRYLVVKEAIDVGSVIGFLTRTNALDK